MNGRSFYIANRRSFRVFRGYALKKSPSNRRLEPPRGMLKIRYPSTLKTGKRRFFSYKCSEHTFFLALRHTWRKGDKRKRVSCKCKIMDTNLTDITSQYAQITEGARNMVKARNDARKYNVDFIPVLIDRLDNYINECERDNKPITMGGLILSSGVPRSTFYDMKQGLYDSVIYEWRLANNIPDDVDTITDDNGRAYPLEPFSDIMQKYITLLQIQLESNCYAMQRGVSCAGSIFGLKSQFNWREDAPAPASVNNTLVVTSDDRATDILNRLLPTRASDDSLEK